MTMPRAVPAAAPADGGAAPAAGGAASWESAWDARLAVSVLAVVAACSPVYKVSVEKRMCTLTEPRSLPFVRGTRLGMAFVHVIGRECYSVVVVPSD